MKARWLVVSCGIAALAACASDESLARSRRSIVRVGMSKDELRESLGEPWRLGRELGESPRETWEYVFGVQSSATRRQAYETFSVFVTVFGSIATVAAMMFSSGASWNLGTSPDPARPDWPGGGRTWRFSVVFGPDDRVVGVTDVW